ERVVSVVVLPGEGAGVGQRPCGDHVAERRAPVKLVLEDAEQLLGSGLLQQLGQPVEAGGGLALVVATRLGADAEIVRQGRAYQHGRHALADLGQEPSAIGPVHGSPPSNRTDGLAALFRERESVTGSFYPCRRRWPRTMARTPTPSSIPEMAVVSKKVPR